MQPELRITHLHLLFQSIVKNTKSSEIIFPDYQVLCYFCGFQNKEIGCLLDHTAVRDRDDWRCQQVQPPVLPIRVFSSLLMLKSVHFIFIHLKDKNWFLGWKKILMQRVVVLHIFNPTQ